MVALKKNQWGYTLVELMIAITLGLLITSAALHLFISGQVGFNTQRGMSEVHDNGNFGLRLLTYEIRKANYGQVNAINDRLLNGGIVITSAKDPLMPSVSNLIYTATSIPVNVPRNIPSSFDVPVSMSGIASNIQIEKSVSGQIQKDTSDQLVIQFYADKDGVDCEGRKFSAGRYIIQRFFLRKDVNAVASKEPNDALVLACEAGWYTKNSTSILKNRRGESDSDDPQGIIFGATRGAIIMNRVDHFHFLLGISNDANTQDKRYISIDDYKRINAYPRPRINSIQIGLLVRSSDNVGQNPSISDKQVFDLLDQKIKLKESNNSVQSKFIRQVITQTIALRNGLTVVDIAEESK